MYPAQNCRAIFKISRLLGITYKFTSIQCPVKIYTWLVIIMVPTGQETFECRRKDTSFEEFWDIIKPNSNEQKGRN